MIDLYYWTTPNGHKISIMLEEAKLAYRVKPINIGRGEQFDPEFLTIAPNNRIPAIVDHAPKDGGQPLSMFESGAILEYLADKSGLFLPAAGRERYIVLQWLHWQMGGLGPMAGQNHHFCHYAPQKIEYAIERYVRETNRLYSVLDQRLANHTYVGGDDYSIADMAIYPWIVPWEKQRQTIEEFPDLERWFEMVKARPAVRRAYALVEEVNPQAGVEMDEQARKHLFGNR
ncbi:MULTISPECIES: glutathione binding-like protein [Halomonadaceae]|uniref:Glutathione S-transferase N-terminal domain-containing protein n=1 Tax=Vreelandella maris TaxID=2729617 RepID=A0A7Y6V7G7_9GAMM|nr:MULTISPECIES: glutathione binding-like protein [Halomonas]EHA17613.1 glutathione S-transferase-like protein [Halomonas sp. HAL1]NVF13214.1 glutathione S-transferase N-terminal domain-containing protein [Halomonas maris]PKG48667.1 thiol:disulfide oxidoreductase [Halomonas sp. MES3-P3E]WKV92202.1 glutathione binding-like protein [Halomonas sp. HAL1]